MHLQFYFMIVYFLYKFSEVSWKEIIKANRENRKGIQSYTVFLQWVASSQNMPPCSGKECCILRHQQLWQTDVSRKKTVFKGIWRDILFSTERYFYGRLEKCCLEIKHVLLSICPKAKRIQGYFIAWETKLCLHSVQVLLPEQPPSRAQSLRDDTIESLHVLIPSTYPQ